MKNRAAIASIIASLLAASVLIWWLAYDPVHRFSLSLPGMDKKGQSSRIPPEEVIIGDSFQQFKPLIPIPGTRWPGFRGIFSDNISREQISLISNFDNTGPKILWKITLGEGHAAPAVYDGCVYLLDYDEKKRADMLRCFDIRDGSEIWRRWYKVRLKRNHGLSRTIPAINERVVVTIGPKCQVMCVDRKTGDLKWGIDMVKTYHAEVPFWYTGQCPLIQNDTVVLAVGGDKLMIGVDAETGEIRWTTPNLHKWKMSHSSVMPMTFQGKKMFVYIAVGGVCGVSASGPDAGKILWESTAFAPSVAAPSPCILDEGRILFTAGYGAGSMLIQLHATGRNFTAEVLQHYRPEEGMASEQQTPVYLQGYIYGIQPKDAGAERNQFVCFKSDNCKKKIMSSGRETRFGLGPYVFADGKFFILNDDGELSIAKAGPSGFIVMDKQQIIQGQDSWGPMAITGGYLLLRDSKQLVCLDIKAR